MKTLENKILVVTGGSGLLGKEIVRTLMSRGGTVINLDLDKQKDTSSCFIECDIRDESSFNNAIEMVLSKYDKIDGFVNNAYPRTDDWGSDFESTSSESWKKNIDWHLNGYALITKKVLHHMKQNNNGSIVFMSSIYGIVGNDFSIYKGTNIKTAAPYSAIKGGLISFSKYLAALYGEYNVRVNCISPGGILDNQDPVFIRNYEEKVPMKRMGNPDDIAPAVAFLLSNDSKYITGHNLVVDGGWTAI